MSLIIVSSQKQQRWGSHLTTLMKVMKQKVTLVKTTQLKPIENLHQLKKSVEAAKLEYHHRVNIHQIDKILLTQINITAMKSRLQNLVQEVKQKITGEILW